MPQSSGEKPDAHCFNPSAQSSLVVREYQPLAATPPPIASSADAYSPHFPHLSYTFPLFTLPSQPLQEPSFPPHTPFGKPGVIHVSQDLGFTSEKRAVTYGWIEIPSHPLHVSLSPPHTLHSSIRAPLLGIPSQPMQLDVSPPHFPQASITLLLATLPSHPMHVELSPPHTRQPS